MSSNHLEYRFMTVLLIMTVKRPSTQELLRKRKMFRRSRKKINSDLPQELSDHCEKHFNSLCLTITYKAVTSMKSCCAGWALHLKRTFQTDLETETLAAYVSSLFLKSHIEVFRFA